jgi:hypothetical protein
MSDVSGRGRFEVAPCIVRSGTTADIEIRPPAGSDGFASDRSYAVTYTPMQDRGSFSAFGPRHAPAFRVIDGTLRISQRFEGEQEHGLLVEELRASGRVPVVDARVYSVDADLFARRPLKGDLHIHSSRSDGRELYKPSLEAREAFAGVPIDLAIFPGEEVHPPDNPIHIVNFGGATSITAQFDEPGWRAKVEQIARTLVGLPPKLDPWQYASALWTFQAIRSCGGLGIFCHPFWIDQRRYHIPGSLADHVFAEQPYDAYEVVGGYHRHEAESNALQVARYHEERVRGKRIPVVGVSDAHGCERGELFGWYFTVVFAFSPALGDLIGAIRDLWSVGVEALPGAPVHVHGPMRLAAYAHFLLREYFPGHDELCREEGEAMRAFLEGDGAAPARLAALQGRASDRHGRCTGALTS